MPPAIELLQWQRHAVVVADHPLMAGWTGVLQSSQLDPRMLGPRLAGMHQLLQWHRHAVVVGLVADHPLMAGWTGMLQSSQLDSRMLGDLQVLLQPHREQPMPHWRLQDDQ